MITTWLKKQLCALNNTDNMVEANGFTRLGFSKEEQDAHKQFVAIARNLGLSTYQDEAGNQWAVWQVDSDAPTVAMGSHLDTVYNGGGYDGVAGVVCALAAIKILQDSKFQPSKNIAIICFVSEESARFGVSTLGSKAVTGKLRKMEVASITDKDGMTVKQAMTDFGVNWDLLEQAELPIHCLEQFLELHIEQGTILEENQAEFGIVNGVACPVRLKIQVTGVANHTGTTPMDKRKDALVAIAPVVQFVSDEAAKLNEATTNAIVATVSTVNLKPNAMNVIPGNVELGIDIRSVDDKLKRNFAEKINAYCLELAEKHQVKIEVSKLVDNNSVLLNNDVSQKLLHVCSELGFSTHVMNSGAGHDAMNMASRWPSGLIFIPCKDGISHQPLEFASTESLEKGTKVMAKFLKQETTS